MLSLLRITFQRDGPQFLEKDRHPQDLKTGRRFVRRPIHMSKDRENLQLQVNALRKGRSMAFGQEETCLKCSQVEMRMLRSSWSPWRTKEVLILPPRISASPSLKIPVSTSL